MKCIVCGAVEGETRERLGGNGHPGQIHISVYKLPHGEVHLCHSDQCRRLLTLELNFATPMVWVTKEDLYQEGYIHILTEEEADNLKPEDLIEITCDAADTIWNSSFDEEYREALDNSAKQWRENKEYEMVEKTPDDGLPLLIGNLKYDKSKELLNQRLKG